MSAQTSPITRRQEIALVTGRELRAHLLKKSTIILTLVLLIAAVGGIVGVKLYTSGQDRAFHSAEPVRSPQHIAQTLHAERIDAVMTVGSVTPEDLVTLMPAWRAPRCASSSPRACRTSCPDACGP